MGWLDASEYFNLELLARDRVDDIQQAAIDHAAMNDVALTDAEDDGEDSTAEECYRKRSTPVPRYRIFAERATDSAWCASAVAARSDAGACSGA